MLLLEAHLFRVLVRVAMKSSAPSSVIVSRHLSASRGRDISCPASRIIAHSSGKVSKECPGIYHVVLMLYFSNNRRRRRTPIVPANSPR